MTILLLGPDRCGKTAAATLLGRELGVEVAETGHVLMARLAQFYSRSVPGGSSMKAWANTIYACKDEYRHELAALGDLLTEASPTYLIDEALRFGPVVVGVRRQCELQGYMKSRASLAAGTTIIQIRAPVYRDSRFELNDCPCDYEVINGGTLDELQARMSDIARLIKSNAA